MDRRSLLLLPFGLIPVTAYARFVEPEWLEIAHERIPIPGIEPGKSIRLVQLSDLHASEVVSQQFIEHSIKIALAQKPDLICITGDFITFSKGWDAEWYIKTLKRIPEHVPCFATLGNHDGGWPATGGPQPYYSTEAVRNLITSSGLDHLFNSARELSFRSQSLRLVGLGDIWAYDCDPDRAFRDFSSANVPTVVLSHNPDSKEMMDDFPWHLMLSGHTHGGQVVVPILGLSPAPVEDKRYVKGLKRWNDHQIFVSAGVGNIDGVRFNCRPQVNVLDLVSPETPVSPRA